jgi:hypothetical protein
LRDPLVRSQFPNPSKPGIIELADRHWVAPFLKMVW